MTITLISLGLAMDALAVSLGIGTSGQIPRLRGKIRLAAHFGIFQPLMAGLGWLVGGTIIQFVKGFDHWIALLLSVVGLFAGARLGETFGKRMEILGGLLLLGIGIRLVLTHVFL